MGYQESYVYVSNDKKFEELIEVIKKHRIDWVNEWDIEAAGIVTLNENLKGTLAFTCKPYDKYNFKKGKKLVHVCGERYGQRSLHSMFGDDWVEGLDYMFAECLHMVEGKGLFGDQRKVNCDYEKFDYGRDDEYMILYDSDSNEVLDIIKGGWNEYEAYKKKVGLENGWIPRYERLAIDELKMMIEKHDLKIDYTDQKYKVFFGDVSLTLKIS